MIEGSIQRTERPDYSETYTRYQQEICDEEARLGRRLMPSEAERINREVFAPLNRDAWAGVNK